VQVFTANVVTPLNERGR